MLRICCPNCGDRDEVEYRFGGEAAAKRPRIDATDAEWADYLFNRTNTKGVHVERWCHSYGCGHWFNVIRDTVTHEVQAVYRIGDPAPETSG